MIANWWIVSVLCISGIQHKTPTQAVENDCPKTSTWVPPYLCGDGLPDNPDPPQLVCCPYADIRVEPIGSTPEPLTHSPFVDYPVTPTKYPVTPPNYPVTPPNYPLAPPKCGIRYNEGISNRIANTQDEESEYGEFPWMVALFDTTDENGLPIHMYRCGGSLIHPRVVLTATHCVNKKRKLLARAGEWDTQNPHERYPHQDRNVQEIIKHENFHRGGLFYNIALLILDSPFETADNVGFVCLPKPTSKFDAVTCTACGWGSHTIGGSMETILKKIDLPVVPRDTCERIFRRERKSDTYQLHESYLCAGGIEGQDMCQGDGGSPLVCPTNVVPNQYVQAGIVSWGRGCGLAQVPGVYTNVAVLREWIDSKMTEKGFDKRYYEDSSSSSTEFDVRSDGSTL